MLNQISSFSSKQVANLNYENGAQQILNDDGHKKEHMNSMNYAERKPNSQLEILRTAQEGLELAKENPFCGVLGFVKTIANRFSGYPNNLQLIV